MGQRLVVSIQNNGNEIATIYYHWSAYTISALMETKELVNIIYDEENPIKDLRLRLIRFCEANGGGISGGADGTELKAIQAMYPNETFKTEGINRNHGLIDLSEEGRQNSHYWSEGDMEIIVDENKIINGVYCGYDDLDEFNREMKECDDEFEKMGLEDIPDVGCDIGYIHVDDIDKVINELSRFHDCIYVRNGNEIYELT